MLSKPLGLDVNFHVRVDQSEKRSASPCIHEGYLLPSRDQLLCVHAWRIYELVWARTKCYCIGLNQVGP
jgi:hypothetical protein